MLAKQCSKVGQVQGSGIVDPESQSTGPGVIRVGGQRYIRYIGWGLWHTLVDTNC
jgi:hypothetical protein